MKQRLSTIMMLAVLIVGGTTTAQAGELISGTVNGGQLSFYSDAACTNNIGEAEPGSTVYIRAIPDYGYTAVDATLSAHASVGSGQAEARSAGHKSETLPFGETIDVTTVDNTRGIYRLTMSDDERVCVLATLAEVTAITVSYVDENYETQTVSAVPLDLTMTALAADQWYTIASDLTFTSGFTSTGNMRIVIPDGATLTVGTESSPVQESVFYTGGNVFLYGQENATGKLSVNTKEYCTNISSSYVIANLNIDVASGYTAFNCGRSGSGCVIAGHPTKSNTVTVRAGGDGIYAGGTPLVIKYCNVDVVANNGTGVYASGGNLTIEGLADGSNDLTVRSCSTAIGAGGGSAVIKFCDIDAVSTNSNGIEGNYGSTGMGVHIEGIADGSNNVTLRCAGYGIYGGGCSVTINYCDVEVTGATQNEAGQYGFCGYSGIYEGGGSGMNIIGCASGNMVVVRSNSSGIEGAGCSVYIRNSSVDVVAKGEYGIYASSGTGITITGLADGSSDVTVRCLNNGIYAAGQPVTILNCDVEVTGATQNEAGEYGFCGGSGIYEGGGSGMYIIGCASGNMVVVRSNSNGINGEGCSVTIKNCSVDITSAESNGIYATSGTGITIEGLADGSSDVTLRCAGFGINGNGRPVTVKYCDVEVTGATQNEAGEYSFCGGSGIYESGGSGMNIIGCASGNMVVVRSNASGINGDGCSVTIKNCSVDVVAKGGYGIYATSGTGITIEGLADGSSDVTVRSNGAGGIYGDGCPVTIKNCTVDITSEGYGIYDTSPLTIDNSDITVESAKSGLYATGSANTITDSRVKVTTADTKQVGHYDAIFSPYGLTISGSQLEASAQEGNWGINLVPTYGAGTATFSWTHPTDYLNVSSCNGPVKVADGQMLTDGSSLYSGELTADEVTAIGGKTLRPGIGVTFAPAGYATYYAGSYDLVLPEGVQAFAVTDKGAVEGTLTYVTVADGDTDQNIVPAGTAVMLKTDAATDVEQTLPVVIGSGADAYSGSNLLSGSDTDTEILTATGYAFYKLAYGPDNTTFGWYWGAEDGQPFTSPAHKAWLTLPASVDARFLGLPEGDATAIAAAAQERVGKDGAWYTIGGVKLDGQPTAKGIYIKDGKKVVIK